LNGLCQKKKISFATTIKHWSVLPLLIDAGIRNVDVVTSAQSNAGERKHPSNKVEMVTLCKKNRSTTSTNVQCR
jgi:hypothetical protein